MLFHGDLWLKSCHVSQLTAHCYNCLHHIKMCRSTRSQSASVTVVNSLIFMRADCIKWPMSGRWPLHIPPSFYTASVIQTLASNPQTIIMHDPTSHLATACTSNSVIYCNTAHTVSLHVVVAVVKRRRRRRHSCCCLLLLMSKNASNWNRSIPLESFHLTALDFVPKHSWWDGADCCPSCMELIVVRRRSCTEARSIVVPGVVRRRFEEVVHYKDQRLRPEQHLRCYVALWGNKRGLSVCCHYQHYCRFFLTSLTVCSYSSLGNFLDLWSRIFMGWIPFLSLWAIRNEADTCCLLIRAGLRSLWVIGTSVLGSRSK